MVPIYASTRRVVGFPSAKSLFCVYSIEYSNDKDFIKMCKFASVLFCKYFRFI